MTRFSRLNHSNVPQHIIQRVNNRQVTFVEVDDKINTSDPIDPTILIIRT